MSFKPFVAQPFVDSKKTLREYIDDYLLKLSGIGKPLALLYSGGIDSEILAISMIEQGIDFKMVTGRNIWPLGVMNEYDLNMAAQFSEKHNIEIEYMDFDFEKIFKTDEYLDIASRVGSPISLTAPVHMMVDRLSKRGFHPIKASGEPVIIKPGNAMVLVDDEMFRTEERLCVDCTVSFFEEAPGVLLSWLDDPIIVNALKKLGSSNIYIAKTDLYCKHFQGLVRRRKQNGFNGFRPYIALKHLQVCRDFKHLHTHNTAAQYIEYSSLVKFLKNESSSVIKSSIVLSPTSIYWYDDDASAINTA